MLSQEGGNSPRLSDVWCSWSALPPARQTARLLCGPVQASPSDPGGIHNFISKHVKMQGFLQSHYLRLFLQFVEHTVHHYRKGNITTYIEDLSEGLKNSPASFISLLHQPPFQ
ncbi:hypothetical protein SAY87_010085 [Trapa incisa]|uniref:Uncharacterized protein n=1 Tax=Trapa incisa TaxID=236973 RepID=A0AAN7GGM0_9MYRT|nr:hypothetical protein SAY87_010085 [Trapa incisa]